MKESLKIKFMRLAFMLYPSYRRTGGRVIRISEDLNEVQVKIPLNYKTRNYVGTIFGGSLYGAVDPIYMIMLIKRLGKKYIVWDKSAVIKFIKPGRTDLFATFVISDEEITAIKKILESQPKLERTYSCEIVDKHGVVHARVEKLLYIRNK